MAGLDGTKFFGVVPQEKLDGLITTAEFLPSSLTDVQLEVRHTCNYFIEGPQGPLGVQRSQRYAADKHTCRDAQNSCMYVHMYVCMYVSCLLRV